MPEDAALSMSQKRSRTEYDEDPSDNTIVMEPSPTSYQDQEQRLCTNITVDKANCL